MEETNLRFVKVSCAPALYFASISSASILCFLSPCGSAACMCRVISSRVTLITWSISARVCSSRLLRRSSSERDSCRFLWRANMMEWRCSWRSLERWCPGKSERWAVSEETTNECHKDVITQYENSSSFWRSEIWITDWSSKYLFGWRQWIPYHFLCGPFHVW